MSDDFQQRGGSPWGTPPGGGGDNGSGRGPTPPDIDKIIREFFVLKPSIFRLFVLSLIRFFCSGLLLFLDNITAKILSLGSF